MTGVQTCALPIFHDNSAVQDSCNKYLAMSELHPAFRAKLLSYKATALSFWVSERERKTGISAENTPYKQQYRMIDSLILSAAETYPSTKTENYCLAYDFFKERNPDDYTNYLDSIIHYGYKPQMHALTMNLDFYSGLNNWAGVEICGLFYDRFSRVGQKQNRKKIKPDVYCPYSCSVLSFGFRQNLFRQNEWAVNFSPVSGSWMWVNARPFNLVYYAGIPGGAIAYSPEIGIHIWNVMVNYAFNLYIGEPHPEAEGRMINIKLQIPVKKFRSN